MKNRKRSRPTTVLALAYCGWPLVTAATTPVDPFSSFRLPSTTTMNELQRHHEDRFMNDGVSLEDETEPSSDDEFSTNNHPLMDGPDGALETTTTSTSYSTVPHPADTSFHQQQQKRHSERSNRKEKTSDNTNDVNSPSYQSMKTLDRLQQMLDDTDYITKPRPPPPSQQQSRRWSPGTSVPHVPSKKTMQPDSLWTSQDRSKYKKQQRTMVHPNAFQEEQMRQQRQMQESARTPNNPPSTTRPSHHHHPPSDDDLSDESEDGLGYTLPNLPVYFSDAEGESETEVETIAPANVYGDTYHPTSTTSYRPKEGLKQPPHSFHPNNAGYYSSYPYPHPQQAHAPPNFQNTYPSQYGGSETTLPSQASATGMIPPSSYYPTHGYMPQWNQHYYPYPQQWSPPAGDQARGALPSPPTPYFHEPPATTTLVTSHATTETVASSRRASLTGRSMQQISVLLAVGSLACFVAVSPRTLPFEEYRLRIFENLRIVSLALIFPATVMAFVYDGSMNNRNDVIHTFFASFSVGYAMAFASEVLLATFIRLAVFSFLEKGIFHLSPRIPVFILPWVLRENGYRPKRITLFAADFLTSCVASPVVEEFFKLKVLQWSTTLPRNFNWRTKSVHGNKSSQGKKTELVAEPVPRRPGEVDVVNANQYVTHMLAASLGLKLCDSIRRILLYTKPHQESKSFFSFCRGVFPIHELCGTMTALGLAKRDLLGVAIPLWKILLPSVVVHGMANFRGMKPIFKWNSSTPWSEMQLYPLAVDSKTSLLHLLKKAYPKLVWLVILGRVFGYCVKNYFMVNRHARKRATTYAGKHAAFSAELATAELLKKK